MKIKVKFFFADFPELRPGLYYLELNMCYRPMSQ